MTRKSKIELLRQAIKLSGTSIYLNEHLTKKNADIAWQAWTLRNQNKIQATWTRNCKVMIQHKRTSGDRESGHKGKKDLDPYRQ